MSEIVPSQQMKEIKKVTFGNYTIGITDSDRDDFVYNGDTKVPYVVFMTGAGTKLDIIDVAVLDINKLTPQNLKDIKSFDDREFANIVLEITLRSDKKAIGIVYKTRDASVPFVYLVNHMWFSNDTFMQVTNCNGDYNNWFYTKFVDPIESPSAIVKRLKIKEVASTYLLFHEIKFLEFICKNQGIFYKDGKTYMIVLDVLEHDDLYFDNGFYYSKKDKSAKFSIMISANELFTVQRVKLPITEAPLVSKGSPSTGLVNTGLPIWLVIVIIAVSFGVVGSVIAYAVNRKKTTKKEKQA